jgi:hypothetical protein
LTTAAAGVSFSIDAQSRVKHNRTLFQSAMLSEDRVNQTDVERIAQATLRELGVVGAIVTVTSDTQPGQWRVEIQGGHGPGCLRVRCGPGSTAQWVRQQIFEQYTAQR